MACTRMGRRGFAGAAAVLGGASWSCDGENELPVDGSVDDSNAGGSASGGSGDFEDGRGGAGGATARTCGEFTPSNIEGPFFSPDSPERTNLVQDSPGPRLKLTGRVFDSNCRPVAGALLDFWQADVDGAYDTSGYTFRGHQFTDERGHYSLESIIPGRYLDGDQFRPAHLHVKVRGPEGILTTQLYFEGDPYNELDPFIDQSLIMAVEESDGLNICEFDFVVSG